MTSAEANLNQLYYETQQHEQTLNCVRSVTDAFSEKSKQKDDSEILNAIVPTEEFTIKYSQINWDDDGTMHLN